MSKSSTAAVDLRALRALAPTKHFSYHHQASVTSLDFDDSGQYLISAGVDQSIQLYDVHKGAHHRDVQSQKYGAHLARFTHQGLNCLYASTAQISAGASADNGAGTDTHQIRLLNLENKQYVRYFKGHHHQVTALEVNPVHDRFISASVDGRVKLWDLRSSHDVGAVSAPGAQALGYDPQGQVMAVASVDSLRLYDPRQCERGPFLDTTIAGGASLTRLEFSNTGKTVLLVTASGNHLVVDAFTGAVLTRLAAPGADFSGFHYPTASATWSPCGKYVLAASATAPTELHVFDLTRLRTSDGGVRTVKPDDNSEVTAPVASLPSPHIAKVVAFDPKLMVLASADNSVVLWQPQFD
ncbi:hypothetical protein DIURU_003973 [Diutina rugosa]|uniref:Anaphase-promoting complex subunit 4 WD40 domain-containing protein n=1 Tax=Diutina rugosa TaxID=5481 RepID=A0A642UR51_DIURU|nr:uncharacterized protein DIURU_003973 [Diutina rugosa]KAA8900157.1 hypothetical protein DIURU_003973 [Diutina rugosa]